MFIVKSSALFESCTDFVTLTGVKLQSVKLQDRPQNGFVAMKFSAKNIPYSITVLQNPSLHFF